MGEKITYSVLEIHARRMRELIESKKYKNPEDFLKNAIEILLTWESEHPEEVMELMKSLMPFSSEQEGFMKMSMKPDEIQKQFGSLEIDSDKFEVDLQKKLAINDDDHLKLRDNFQHTKNYIKELKITKPENIIPYDGFPLLSGFYSRFLPVKIVLTVLGHLLERTKESKVELKNLRAKDLLNNFLVLENKRLKLIVEDYVIESDSIYAKVLSDKNSPFLKSIIINKGSKHGINRGSVVKDNEYLVGKIVEVNFTTSRVLLLSDINSKIPVLIEPQGLMAILSGSKENNGTIQYSRIENIIDDKSIVYTSGTGNLFKAGIPVGIIIKKNIKSIRNNVEFFSDFSQLKFVQVLFLEKKASE